MTFNEWLNINYPDWQSEYSGSIFGMEDAWNAAITTCLELVKQERMTDDVQNSEYPTAENACNNIETAIRHLESSMPEFTEWRERAKASER